MNQEEFEMFIRHFPGLKEQFQMPTPTMKRWEPDPEDKIEDAQFKEIYK